jgi:hypothetical protein
MRGDIVTFTYDSFSRRALPINPKIFRKRSDVTWEEVLRNHEKDAQVDGMKKRIVECGAYLVLNNRDTKNGNGVHTQACGILAL